jgi:hypothetical protein
MDDVIANIVLQDVTVLHLTSGDAGCPNSSLHDNAVHLMLAIGAQSVAHDVYLLRWKNQADFDAAADAFDDCVAEYVALQHGVQIGSVQATPWRAYGSFWNPMLRTILENALRTAGGG